VFGWHAARIGRTTEGRIDMRTDFLFVQPSFLRGFGRIFDVWGQLNDYNFSITSAEADIIALRSDWEMIGRDFREGVKAYKRNADQLALFATAQNGK
jgi:hypothetical protein